jgi:branched-chain amino acid transport system ATP-binding protein
MGAIIKLEGISQTFGALRAVSEVAFTAEDQAITSLIGPNGAGKTTVFNMLTGFLVTQSGRIVFRDRPIEQLRPFEIARLGIGRTFQDPRVFAEMSVLDNVMVGLRQNGEWPLWAVLRGGRVHAEWRAARERSEQMLEAVGLLSRANEPAKDLSFGEQRFLSIARTLVSRPALILMDEPTVGLDRGGLAKLLELMRRMVSDLRTALLVIEHNMDVVMSMSSKVVLMVQGAVVAGGTAEEIRRHPSMRDAYLGKKHAS